MDTPESLPLGSQLSQLFARAAGAELPNRVVISDRDQAARPLGWGRQPVAIFAIREPLRIVVAEQDDIDLEVGDATILSARDLTRMQPGGRGQIVAVESAGTQPCQFFVADAADPAKSRQCLEMFYTPCADSLRPCWEACNEIYKLLDSARLHATDPNPDSRFAMRGLMQLCAVECHRALQAFGSELNLPAEKTNTARVQAAAAFLSCNIGRDIRKPELAAHIGISVSQLTLTFREMGQLSVRDRIRFRRIEFARNLLADTNLSVSEVAGRVGMRYRHFIRAFRQNVRLTPLRYRKLARLSDKSPEIWSGLIHTENFEKIEPLAEPGGAANLLDGPGDSSVSVLFSNLTSGAIRLLRRNPHAAFSEVGIVAAEKRLAFLDHPGRVWKIQPCDDEASEPTFFKTGKSNSHFVIGPGGD